MIEDVEKMMKDSEYDVNVLVDRMMSMIEINSNLDATILVRAVGKVLSRFTRLKLYQNHAYSFSSELLSQMEKLGNPKTSEEFTERMEFHKLLGDNVTAKCDPADQHYVKSLGDMVIRSLIAGAATNNLGLCYNTLLPSPIIFVKHPDDQQTFIPLAIAVDAVNDGITEYIKESREL